MIGPGLIGEGKARQGKAYHKYTTRHYIKQCTIAGEAKMEEPVGGDEEYTRPTVTHMHSSRWTLPGQPCLSVAVLKARHRSRASLRPLLGGFTQRAR